MAERPLSWLSPVQDSSITGLPPTMLPQPPLASRPAPDESQVRPAAPAPVELRYRQTESFVALLHELRATLLVSTYQANKLLAVRPTDSGLSTLVRTFERPMGIAADSRRMALGTRSQIWLLRNAPDIAPRVEPVGVHDACYLPRTAHVTGDVGVHELAYLGDELWFVSTRFSCLATLAPDYSFVPQWRPPFISRLAAEDRCHLNGLAVVNEQAGFVTALGATDEPDGWRAGKARGGCILDVPTGESVVRGLSMPHSPRWYQGRLWVLESGTGTLLTVDASSGTTTAVARLPGFARGMAICGPYAFIGLSRIRPTSAMDGVPLADRREHLKCGVAVVDLRSTQIVALLEFQSAIEELFDVQVLRGVQFPEILGFQQDSIHHTFVVPVVC